MSELLEQLPPIAPMHFFAVTVDLKEGKTVRLPEFSDFLGEVSFADVSMTWKKEGLSFEIVVHKPFEEAAYPDYEKGDAVELFIDTRDLKTAGFFTRFCHHFLILPKEVQGIHAQELSHFRTEETHPLCDPQDIFIESSFRKKEYRLKIGLPAAILHGYDPAAFDRLGFTYRIHRTKGPPQHFCLSSALYKIEQQPALWASFKLI